MSDAILADRPVAPRAALLIAGIALAHAPLLVSYGYLLWLREHYQFFPFAVAGFVVLLTVRVRSTSPSEPGHPLSAGVMFAVGISLLTVATWLWSPWLGMVSAIWAVLAAAYHLGGPALLKSALGPAALLLVILMPPLQGDQILIREMQSLVSWFGSRTLDVFGVVHVMEGNVVRLPEGQLFVEEACSGIHSLFSTLTVTLFYALWVHRRWYHTAGLMIAAVGWVIVVNVARVALIAYSRGEWSTDLSAGWRHEALGVALFAGCLFLVWSTDQFLLFLAGLIGGMVRSRGTALGEATPAPRPETRDPRPDRRGPLALAVVLVPFLLVGAVQLARASAYGLFAARGGTLEPEALPIDTEVLPAEIDGWVRVGEARLVTRDQGGVFGDFSHVWTYRNGELEAAASLDYAFPGWHDLAVCYRDSGWALDPPDAGGDPPHVEIAGHKSFEEHGYVLFNLIGADGRWLAPEGRWGVTERVGDRFGRRFAPTDQRSYQFQVFVAHPLPLDDAQREQVRGLFAEVCEHFRAELIRQRKVTP